MSMFDMLAMMAMAKGKGMGGYDKGGGKGWGKGGKGKGGGWGGGWDGGWDGGWGGDDWGGKRKADEVDERPRDLKSERRGLFSWIAVPYDAKLTAEGYMLEGAAALYEKENNAYASATYALKKVIDDIYTEMEIIDLTYETKYPEIIKAVADVGFKHQSVCIALCPKLMRWGVGLGGKMAEREKAAKLSLAVAVASGSGELLNLCRKVPDVAYYCAAEGAYALPQGRRWKLGGEGMEEPEPAPEDGNGITPGCYPIVGISVDSNPAWMTAHSLPATAPAVYHDKTFGDAFSSSAWIMEEVIGADTETNIVHDDEMDKFPEVMEAIKAAGGDENSFCIITAPSLQKWAVGVAGGAKTRERAAKLALAIACITDQKKLTKYCSQHDGFGFLCSAAGLLPPELSSSRNRYRERGW
eukprot:TRINITY_DN9661_c0_g1_i1.p1 TRINITY_DN9661_c0_g1~~TRINITY_DN9661_c0_g1_i1.p1  ORF type:complete len:412 (-),score=151.96 TRINITY_DN9661_c0_g1_i1:200-1435(-)